MGRTMSRLFIAGGALAAGAIARSSLARMYTPYMPDIALHAGIELVSKPRRTLAIARRPGDLEFHIGGSLFLLANNQSRVTAVVLTQGERSSRSPSIGEIRSKEQRAAASVLGVDLLQYSLPEGKLHEGPGLRSVLEDAWRKVNPEVVFAPDPQGPLFFPNSDDAAIADALLGIARQAATANARLYLYATRRANVIVDITETIQEKVSAVQCHRSQLKGPDGASRWYVRSTSRLSRGRTPAMYTESLYRLV